MDSIQCETARNTDPKPNILYLINYAGNGGSEKYVRECAKYAVQNGYGCRLCYNLDGKLTEHMSGAGVPSVQIKMRNPFDIGAARKIAAYCREHDIGIIHAQFPRENCIAILAKLFYPRLEVVFTSHLNIVYPPVWRVINKTFARFDGQIIAVCVQGRKLLTDGGFPKDKISVIFNGVEYYRELPRFETSIRDELNIGDDTAVIFTAGRFSPEKGFDFLLDSISRLKQLTADKFILLIAGEGELYNRVNSRITETKLENNVKLLGFRDDVPRILSGCDIFVNSSSSEAAPYSILEAMNFGLPVAATNVGGDIITPETNCGILVEYGDTDAMANALAELIRDKEKARQYGQNARNAIRDIFNIDRANARTFGIYDKLCQTARE